MGNKIDLTGQKFGRLTVIKEEKGGMRPNGQKFRNWLCRCDCGNEVIVRTSYLTCGETKSCGCLLPDIAKHHYEGKKFGNLTVIKEDGRNKDGCIIWLCKCDCGNEFRTTSTYLRRGYSTSCGCQTSEKMSKSSETHGMHDTRLYQVWSNMKSRCNNPNNKRYKNYGGRGIKVCKEWEQDFKAFYDWAIMSGYDSNANFGECTIDRIDINGDYEPNNCRWISNKEQQSNRQNNRFIKYKNETKTLTQWSECLGISFSTLKYRLDDAKWSIDEALETPVKNMK